MSVYENMIVLSVKMGSHRFGVNASWETGMTSSELISLAIVKCRLSGNTERLAKTYAVFESSNGIERQLDASDDLVKLAAAVNNSVEFVVRKITRVEKRVAGRRVQTDKFYRELKRMQARESSERERIQVYEDVERDARLRARIEENERVLREQTDKLAALESSIVRLSTRDSTNPECRTSCCSHVNKTKLRENIGVLRTLYAKLRAVQMRRIYEAGASSVDASNKSITSTCSRAMLIDSGVNSCGSSSCSGSGDEDEATTTESLV